MTTLPSLVMTIQGEKVGHGQEVFIVCEAGVTNYGDMRLAKKQVDVAVKAGANAIKFQAWKTENLVSKKVSQTLEKELGYNWFDRLKYKEFQFDQLRDLRDYCVSKNIIFFATPHDEDALNFLADELNVPVLKVGSGESSNYEFLERVGAKKLPVIISFGMQSDSEASRAVETLRVAGAKEIAALHCVSIYPTPANMVDLLRIERLKKHLQIQVGISDHSIGWHIPLAAATLGASIIEKHLTFNKTDPRSLDNPGALLPKEFKEMVSQVREIEQAKIQVPEEIRETSLESSKAWAIQSIVARMDIDAGTVLTRDMVAFKRPGKGGIPPSHVQMVIGKRTKVCIGIDEQILPDQLA